MFDVPQNLILAKVFLNGQHVDETGRTLVDLAVIELYWSST
jgi:hypothetical protein